MLLFFLTIALWWLGTAAVWQLGRQVAGWRTGAACGLVVAATLVATHLLSPQTSVGGSILGFIAALALWGALELAHLHRWLAGPVRDSCPPEARGPIRFLTALGVGLYHDLAILAALGVLWWLAAGAENQTAALAFTVLWLMRWSAKLNLYLGVANFDDGLVPARLRYMASYMRKRAMNPLYPLSLVLAVGLAYLAYRPAFCGACSEGAQAGAMLVGTLAVLGLVEHLLLMVPFRDSQLWQWTNSRQSA